jgi:hypothetical protein
MTNLDKLPVLGVRMLGALAIGALAAFSSYATHSALRGRVQAGGIAATTPPAAPPSTSPPTCACGTLKVPLAATIPSDATLINQTSANCFGWWEFIALNWPTAAGAGFGDPGDVTPVQWETYMPIQLLFQPGAAVPPAWGTLPPIPSGCEAQVKNTARGVKMLQSGKRPPLLAATAKFTVGTANPTAFPDSIEEAAPFKAPNWLGAQNGTNLWYEIGINQDEYNYVVQNKLYDATQQAAMVNNGAGKPIILPAGQSGGATGAMELKAAWMEVTDPDNTAKWNRYKLSEAVVIDPNTNQCRPVILALVGLHILHKTQSQPTWVWATFEHVDNVQDSTEAKGPFNFFNPNCQSQQFDVPASCLGPGQTSPVTIGCTANTPPPYYICEGGPKPVPIQVTRTAPIQAYAQQVNQSIQKFIAQNYPKSVWQNYQLINVIWSTSPVQNPIVPKPVPMSLSGMLPTSKVANVTMETYAQTLTCTDCHTYATIAPSAGVPNPTWASDFSFALGTATSPPSAPLLKGDRRQPRR